MPSELIVTNVQNRAGYNEIRSRRLTSQQQGAIRLAAAVGHDMQKDHPEIAEEYRSGVTAPKLVARHGFDHRYGVNWRAVIGAVRNAIRGYSGPYYDPYQGLIANVSEREDLALAHNRQTGTALYEEKRGIHALTHEEKVDAGRKGGLIRGPLSHLLRIIRRALPREELREPRRGIAALGGRTGGTASAVTKSRVRYISAEPGRVAEIEFANRLAADPRCLGPVRTDFKRIADEVNEAFHAGNPHYTRTTLKIALQSHCRHNRSAAGASTDREMLFAEKLARDPAYQLPARVKAAQIARKVNEEYHGGKPVRNACSIRAAIRRYLGQGAGRSAS
jgi:hypothetical protein